MGCKRLTYQNFSFLEVVHSKKRYRRKKNRFSYDLDGNLTSDKNKGIKTIKYNHLNLPTLINFGGGNKIKYYYDAVGTKLKKIVTKNGVVDTTTDYMDNGSVYENDELQFMPTAEGYVTKSGNIYKYVYQFKDHLGNIRLSYSDNNGDGNIVASSDPNTNEIIEENNYYPFGLKHKGYNSTVSSNGNSIAQRWKFGGKELQDEVIGNNSLGWYDITARNYDPALGRWMNIDPLTQKMPSHSPYNYAFNNPINFIDEDGEAPIPAWIIRTVVINAIKVTSKVTLSNKIAKANSQLQDVRSEISSKKGEIFSLRTTGGESSKTGGFKGGFSSKNFGGGGGAGGSYGTPMTPEESAKEQVRADAEFKKQDPESFEKAKKLEKEIGVLEDKSNGLEKKIDNLKKTQKLVRSTDPDKIVKEVSEQIGENIFQLVKAVKDKINKDVERRRKEEEK